jgi:membrane-bound lytic murein transglycosylase D
MKLFHIAGLVVLLWLAGCATPPAADQVTMAPAAAAAKPAEPIAPAVIPSGPLAPITAAEAASRAVAQLKPPADLWERIRRGFAMPNLQGELVRQQEQWYVSRPDYIQRMTERSRKYLFHVVEELERRNMPTELALLPFIESAFNPQAVSSARAAGMWQFMPATGQYFELKQNVFRDDRRDVLASTKAALDYLQKLYGMFGDWQLALAAYNWGEGNVQKAIAKNQAAGKPTDFESLAELMPAETRNYVPKLQAVKNIIANPAQFGVVLPAIDNQPYFTTVDKTSDIDLTIAAQLAELSVDEFKALNPQFNRPVITGDEQTKILLPKENAEKFHLNLAQWGRALSTWTTHRITGAKESIAQLASRFGTTPDVIRQANNIPSQSRLKAGSTILVPKISTSANADIAEQIVDNAVMSFEADRPGKRVVADAKPLSGAAKFKAKAANAVAEIKSRVGKHAKSKKDAG